MKRTAIYLRVSTDKQSNGLEAQRMAIDNYLKNIGVEYPLIFTDENQSGAKTSRPGLDALMDSCRSREVSTVIVYSFSRFARSTRQLLDALDEFNHLKINFISITEKIDTASPMGRAFFTIISALGQLERELIAERVRNGLANAKSKGKRLGRPKTRNDAEIRKLRSAGLSLRAISKQSHFSLGSIQRSLGVSKTF